MAVSGDDHARLAERADALVWFDGIHAYMRMVDGHCSALGIDVSSGEFVCNAYANRPQICRDLVRGSGACLGEREMKATRPLLALRRSRGVMAARPSVPPRIPADCVTPDPLVRPRTA